MTQNDSYLCKLLLVGARGVGKSCLSLRYTEDTFANEISTTINVDFKLKTVSIGDIMVKQQIWDHGSSEKSRPPPQAYYKGASGFVVCFDITNRESFHEAETHIKEIRKFSEEGPSAVILCGLKIDLQNNRQITPDDATTMANNYGIKYVEACSKTNIGVTEVFTEISKIVLEKGLAIVKNSPASDSSSNCILQ